MNRAASTPVLRMPRSKAKLVEQCHLCPMKIKLGQWVAKDFDTQLWAHVGCVVRKVNGRRRSAELVSA